MKTRGGFGLRITATAALVPLFLAYATASHAAAPDFSGKKDLSEGLRGASIYPADVDGDGDTDLIFTNNTTFGWAENKQGTFSDHPINNTGSIPSWLTTGDVDGDGDVDILVKAYGATSDGKIAWFENLGQGRAFERHEVAQAGTNLSYTDGLAIGDVDGDGKADIITAGGSDSGKKGVQWLKNTDGKGVTWAAPEQIYDMNASCLHLFFTDLNKDGTKDLVFQCGSYDHPNLVTAINKGNARFESKVVISEFYRDDGVPQPFALADLDKDGYPDLVKVSNDLSIFQNVNGTAFGPTDVDTEGNILYSSVVVGDYDNDGDLDILVARNNSLIWYEKDGSAWKKQEIYKKEFDIVGQTALIDVDGDGNLDIVQTGIALSPSYWMRNQTTAKPLGPVTAGSSGGTPTTGGTPGTPAAVASDDDGDDAKKGCNQAGSLPLSSGAMGAIGAIGAVLGSILRRRRRA